MRPQLSGPVRGLGEGDGARVRGRALEVAWGRGVVRVPFGSTGSSGCCGSSASVAHGNGRVSVGCHRAATHVANGLLRVALDCRIPTPVESAQADIGKATDAPRDGRRLRSHGLLCATQVGCLNRLGPCAKAPSPFFSRARPQRPPGTRVAGCGWSRRSNSTSV